jgi:hypothetical protein
MLLDRRSFYLIFLGLLVGCNSRLAVSLETPTVTATSAPMASPTRVTRSTFTSTPTLTHLHTNAHPHPDTYPIPYANSYTHVNFNFNFKFNSYCHPITDRYLAADRDANSYPYSTRAHTNSYANSKRRF